MLPIEEQAWRLYKQQEGVSVCIEMEQEHSEPCYLIKLAFVEFVVITGQHAQVLHCIVKGDTLEYMLVGSLPNFWCTISDKFVNF